METARKLELLREKMHQYNIDCYYVNTADPHQSEYVPDAFRARAWLTGFTGSQGSALITRDAALLWADGRYFIQAAKQIAGTEFVLMKMAVEGVPTIEEWLVANLPEGSCLGFNGDVVSQQNFVNFQKILQGKSITLRTDVSLVEDIWEDRPELPHEPLFIHEQEYTGLDAGEKLSQVRQHLQEKEVDAAFYARLDDICWLTNLRSGDILNNPVSLAFLLVTQTETKVFLDPRKLTDDILAYLAKYGIEALPYAAVYDYLSNLRQLNVSSLLVDPNIISCNLYRAITGDTLLKHEMDFPRLLKANLNDTEQRCLREIYVEDAVALTKFIYWVKQNVGSGELDELNTTAKLHALRAESKYFIDDSFATISAYGSNGAMMHYSAKEDSYSNLEARGFYLIDSGGQYLKGTTDITRTLSLGELTEQERLDYTYTLKSHIALARAKFLKGITGDYLDMLARQPLWQHYLDYKCGTGHAVGYVLGVHEGPQRISRHPSTIILSPGMLVTNEPGVYREGEYGIRLENNLIVYEDKKVGDDTYYAFETISYIPFDRDAIVVAELDAQELAWLNDYQQQVLRTVGPHLNEEEHSWLVAETAPLGE